MSPTYTDAEFIDAVDGRISTHAVAEKVGCTQTTAHRRLYDLAKEGEVAFMHVPWRRETSSKAIVMPPDVILEPLHTPPEEWPTPVDELKEDAAADD